MSLYVAEVLEVINKLKKENKFITTSKILYKDINTGTLVKVSNIEVDEEGDLIISY